MDNYPSAAHKFHSYLLSEFPKQLLELLRTGLDSSGYSEVSGFQRQEISWKWN